MRRGASALVWFYDLIEYANAEELPRGSATALPTGR